MVLKNSLKSQLKNHQDKGENKTVNFQQITNPVLIVDDLDYAAMLVLHWGRGHRLFWLHWLCCFLLQLLLGDNGNKNILTNRIFFFF